VKIRFLNNYQCDSYLKLRQSVRSAFPGGGPFKAKKLKGYALFVFGLPQQINLRADSPEHKKSRN